jgi:hypothetical protein
LAPIVAALLLHAAAAGPVATLAPAITGTLQQGKQLTVSTGTWTTTGTTTYAYQWYRCDSAGAHCSSIHGATRASYTEVAKDIGGAVSAAVAATDTTGTTRAFAPLAGLVAAKSATVLATAQPAITGTATVGQVLTVATVSWSATPTTPTFAWLRCNANERLCTPIAGAATAAYTVSTDDVGSTVVAGVSASGQTVLSLPTAAVTAAQGPTLAVRPSAGGTLQQGSHLAAHPGTWVGSGTIAFAYQWYRCDANAAHCNSIHGATKASYLEVAKDVGHTLALTVRATDATGTATAYAPVVGVVGATSAVAATKPPSLTGKATVGGTLTVKAATWSAKPGALTYAWLRCNLNGRACTGVAGAALSRYVLTADDRGHEIVATVIAAAGTSVLTAASLVVS